MIRSTLAPLLSRLAGWLAQARPAAPGWPLPPGRPRPPSSADLLAELKSTAWACASLNASACAASAPRLYVRTAPGQPPPRRPTRALPAALERRLRAHGGSSRVEEVHDHPLLDLLRQANPVHNGFDLLELLTLSQEVHGRAYWLVEPGPLGVPAAVWPLPAHLVTPERAADSPALVDAYVVRVGAREERLPPERVIAFRYPDPADPYAGGLSPLRACYEQARLMSDAAEFKRQRFDNHAVPDALVCPEQVIGEDERARLEAAWNQRMRRGAGRVVVTESAMRVQLMEHSMGDLAALADLRATKEDVCNAFAVPLAYFTSETNLANLRAAETQHARHAVLPRLRRRDEKLNEQLVPLYDPTGRLFLASDDPVPADREQQARERELALRHGVMTINEARSDEGLPPVPWGDRPWLPGGWRQVP